MVQGVRNSETSLTCQVDTDEVEVCTLSIDLLTLNACINCYQIDFASGAFSELADISIFWTGTSFGVNHQIDEINNPSGTVL